jgi:hypothetical protein
MKLEAPNHSAGVRSRFMRVGCYFFAFRRSAQYCFILSPTAFRCAAVNGLRCLRRVGLGDGVSA